MRHSWANTALLILVILLLLSGFWGLVTSSGRLRWVMGLHGIAGYGLVVLLAWKGRVIVDAFRRGRRELSSPTGMAFLFMAGLLMAILATGLIWSHLGPSRVLGLSTINAHAFLAVGMVALLAWHALARRFVFRIPAARSRRAALRAGGIALAGFGLWLLDRPVQAILNLPGATRRFTGSYETGSLGGVFPPTSWLFDSPPPIDPRRWSLSIDGAVRRPLTLSYEQVLALPADTTTALLDCTGGWYTTQNWLGVNLGWLLDETGLTEDARSIRVESITGYARSFPLDKARRFLLATAVAGQPLGHGHGFPLRLVAPERRGFDWVKWVVHIQVETGPAWVQPPLPLQ